MNKPLCYFAACGIVLAGCRIGRYADTLASHAAGRYETISELVILVGCLLGVAAVLSGGRDR